VEEKFKILRGNPNTEFRATKAAENHARQSQREKPARRSDPVSLAPRGMLYTQLDGQHPVVPKDARERRRVTKNPPRNAKRASEARPFADC
jgi:hypothetical protein